MDTMFFGGLLISALGWLGVWISKDDHDSKTQFVVMASLGLILLAIAIVGEQILEAIALAAKGA